MARPLSRTDILCRGVEADGCGPFSRGLCIRPQTSLRYRLGGDIRRLQAIVGIDESVKDGNGDCD